VPVSWKRLDSHKVRKSKKEMVFEAYGTTFNVDARYTFVKALGKGAYGVVCSAKDVKTGNKVALKKICPMAKSVYDAKHTLREIKLLRHCGQHANVITLVDLMVDENLDELYIGMECMDTDLHRIIQSSQKLSISHHKHFMYQLVLGIEFLHSHGILHRDLKPANLLVSKNCDLRISDFGLARRAPNATDGKPLMTEHVVTRWYRPPELMLSPDGKYTAAVDVWSIGCIFAELIGRTPLFPGKNFVHQLQLIFDVIGTPHSSETAYIKNSQAIQFLRSLPKKGPVDLATIYPQACKESIDFMSHCMRFTANERITVKQALQHRFFDNAPLKGKPIHIPRIDETKFNFDFEQKDLDEKKLRKLIIDEVESFTMETGLRPVHRKLNVHLQTSQLLETEQALSRVGERTIQTISARTASNDEKKGSVRPQSAASSLQRPARDYHRMEVMQRQNHQESEKMKAFNRENESYGNTSLKTLRAQESSKYHATGHRLKKKSRSFTSKILSSSVKQMKPDHGGEVPKLPSVHRASSMRVMQANNQRVGNSSPMSCSSEDEDSPMASQRQHEPHSSMLPIRNILRRSRSMETEDDNSSYSSTSSSTSSRKAIAVANTRQTRSMSRSNRLY